MANTLEVLAVANQKFADEVKNVDIQSVDGFSGNVVNLDLTSFEAGDKFTITGDEKLYRKRMGTNRRGEDVFSEWAVVEVHNGSNVSAKNFYIKSVNKRVSEYDKNPDPNKRKSIANKFTKGTLVDMSKRFTTNQEFWTALKGKTVTIPEVEEVYTLRFDSRGKEVKTEADFYKAQLPTYNVSE